MLKILLYIVITIFIIFGAAFAYFNQGLIKYRKMAINDVDLQKTEDGIYLGEFTGGRWKNKIEVTIKDHRITDIKMLQASDMSGLKDIGEKVFKKVEEKQSLQIDTVSGATVHTKAILKSIENALQK
ncbi:MAG: FMN-binding protein [Atribacterota bacterium]|nr:FMN-binding protein [Atribacterota bacterium]